MSVSNAHSVKPTAVHFRPQGNESPYAVRVYSVSDEPDVWWLYSNGAERQFRRHGIRSAMVRDTSPPSAPTWCALAELDDEILGGVCMHGANAKGRFITLEAELNGARDRALARTAVKPRLAEGVVHCGGLWAVKGGLGYPGLAGDLGRSQLALAAMHSARWIVATASNDLADAWRVLGFQRDESLPPLEGADMTSDTCLMWCDLHELGGSLASWVKAASEAPLSGIGVLTTLRPFT